MKIDRFVVSAEIEKRIIIGLITDTNFCTQMLRMAKKPYFKSEDTRTIFHWVQDYFKAYKKAPGKEIQHIFSKEQARLKEANAEIIATILSNLSEENSLQGPVNYEHLTDQARDYFKERSCALLAEKVQGELSLGRVGDAEAAIREFNKVSKEISAWFNPLDPVNIRQVFNEDDDAVLFQLPGPLGEMAGKFERDWLIAFMAPMKRGKSWILQELAVHALMNRLKVAYFSFEMNKRAVSKRIFKRLTAMAATAGNYKIPVFDCEQNQTNLCKKEERQSIVGIKAPGAKTPDFDKPVKGYKACVACKDSHPEDYVQAYWFTLKHQAKDLDATATVKAARAFRMLYGDNFRVMAYPAFSASFEDAEADLDELELQEGFVPDVICWDYFDIMNPGRGSSGDTSRDTANRIWMQGKGQAARRHCLNATVLQSNRKSISRKSLQQEDTAEDIRKLAHVDELFGLNQTPDEKDMGIMRWNVVGHRHEEFSFKGEVVVTENFALGQPLIDQQVKPKTNGDD